AGPSRVAIAHGEMQVTVTPNSAISNARLFVNAMMAPFEVAYIAGVPPCIPATEDRLMILPERCAFMARAAARVAQTVPMRLTPSIRSIESGLASYRRS